MEHYYFDSTQAPNVPPVYTNYDFYGYDYDRYCYEANFMTTPFMNCSTGFIWDQEIPLSQYLYNLKDLVAHTKEDVKVFTEYIKVYIKENNGISENLQDSLKKLEAHWKIILEFL